MKLAYLTFVVALLFCGTGHAIEAANLPADAIFVNGKIWTVNPQQLCVVLAIPPYTQHLTQRWQRPRKRWA